MADKAACAVVSVCPLQVWSSVSRGLVSRVFSTVSFLSLAYPGGPETEAIKLMLLLLLNLNRVVSPVLVNIKFLIKYLGIGRRSKFIVSG